MENSILRRYLAVSAAHLRYNAPPHLALAALIAVLTPAVFGVNDLDAVSAAVPLELMMSLTGVVLLTPAFFPEMEEGILEAIRARRTSYTAVCAVRTACALGALILLTGAFLLFMRGGRCEVGLYAFFGTLATEIFLGGLGMAAWSVTDSPAVGYMAPVLYYAFSYTSGPDRLGAFYLFSMMRGGGGKGTLLLGGLALMAAALLVKGILFKRGRQ